MKAKRTLEINPSHPIVKQMLKTVENKEEDKTLEQ
jgi:HSP90 family molecular chaperone